MEIIRFESARYQTVRNLFADKAVVLVQPFVKYPGSYFTLNAVVRLYFFQQAGLWSRRGRRIFGNNGANQGNNVVRGGREIWEIIFYYFG